MACTGPCSARVGDPHLSGLGINAVLRRGAGECEGTGRV